MMRIGVDVGGTFTDVVLETSGELFSTKILTTYDAPEEGVLAGIRALVADAEADLSNLKTFIYGTTLATNALLGRTGAHTALVTTHGFRDAIEIAHGKSVRTVRPEP
jgi:N-methylhydantoinase A